MVGVRGALRVVPELTFATVLRTKRMNDNRTQADLAREIGVRQQTVAAWERGDRPQPRFLPALATYLGLEDVAQLRDLLEQQAEVAVNVRAAGAPTDDRRDSSASGATDLLIALTESYIARLRMAPMTAEEVDLYQRVFAFHERRVIGTRD